MMAVLHGKSRFSPIVILVVIGIFYASCVSTKKSIYFDNIGDSTILSDIISHEPVIQKNDLLSISVTSLNAEANRIFNNPANLSGETRPANYLVNQEGYIEFPFIGGIKAEGVTKRQLKENILKSLIDKKLLVDPIVDVRYLNYKVSVLGEVAHPSVLNVASERITLLEALGLAGDLTIYARRDNIMVIREEEGNKKIKRLNLNSGELFTSPYYYLKSNDIVYVEPNKNKIASVSRSTQVITAVFAALSFVVVVLDHLTR